MSDPQPPDSPDEMSRRGSLVLRTLPIMLIPLGVSLITVVILRLTVALPPELEGHAPPSPALPILVLVVFFSALIVLVRLRRPNLSAIGLIGIWTLLTVGLALRGGLNSNTVALLIVPICVAGLLIDGVASISLAALATLLVVSLAWLEVRGIELVTSPAPPIPPLGQAVSTATFWISLFWTIAALTYLLSSGLQRALRESRRSAADLRRLSEELEARVAAQTTELLARAEEQAMLEERGRLAREIHDTLAQGLAGVVVQLGAARMALEARQAGDSQAAEALASSLGLAERTARATLAEARRSVWNLRAPLLERGDLGDALEQLAAETPPGVEARFSSSGTPWPLAPAVELALLRVAQEALANAGKHAGASRVTLALAYEDDGVRLTVQDDGVGFPAPALAGEAAPGPAGGFGLLGMRERLAALGGRLELTNREGARVEALVPRPSAG